MLVIPINKRASVSISKAQDKSDHHKEDDQSPELCQIKDRIESVAKAHILIFRCQPFLFGTDYHFNQVSSQQTISTNYQGKMPCNNSFLLKGCTPMSKQITIKMME